MKRITKSLLVIMLTVSMLTGSVYVQSTRSEAFFDELVEWGKNAVKKIGEGAKKAVNGAKDYVSDKISDYKKKEKARKAKAFKVKAKSYKMLVGESIKIKTGKTYGNKIKWKSTKKKVASVSASGQVKAKKAGTTYIIATPSISKKVSKIKIKVTEPKVTKLTEEVEVDEEYTYSGKNVAYYESSDEEMADIRYDASLGKLVISTYATGRCKIAIVYEDGSRDIITLVIKEKEEPEEDPGEEYIPTIN